MTMKLYVVTIFPDAIERFAEVGLLGRAQKELVRLETIDPRQFTDDRHRSVDDTPYGGGSGMVMKAPPLVAAMEEAERRAQDHRPLRLLLSPQGTPFDQSMAQRLSTENALTLVCARYEGIDERARRRVDLELSLGDFVLMGGEIAALAVIEAVARLIPGVLGNLDSVTDESHASGRLEYPHFTRPPDFRGETVPEVLLGGHHAQIATWRRKEALLRTARRRPDLLAVGRLSAEERRWLAEAEGSDR